MPPLSLAESMGRYLTFAEREEIAIMRAKGAGVRQIARALQRDPGTISRELRRIAATRSGKREYRATVAQWKAQQAAERPRVAKLVTNERLREYVQGRLDASVRRGDGTAVAGAGLARIEGPQGEAPTSRSPLGHGLEPAADQQPPPARLRR